MQKQILSGPSGTKNLTEGSPARLMLEFALPVFLSQVFQQLYNTADTFIVAHYLDTEALAAVSSSGTLINLLVSFFNGMAMGAGVLISRYFGAKEDDRVSRAIHTNLTFGLLSGLFLTVVGVLFTPTLLRWMKTDSDVLPDAIEYFRYYFLGVTATVLYNICRGIMNALGDSGRPLWYLIFSSLLNILLDWLFVGVIGWGVWSAAVATVVSQASSVVFCMMHLCRKDFSYRVTLRQLKLYPDMLRDMLRYGLPSGVQNSVICFANVIVQTQINSFGKFATAAFGVHSKLEGFTFLPVTSFCMAIATFVGQNVGAGKVKRAKQGARFGIISSVLMAETIGIIGYIFAPQLIAVFNDTPEVLELGTQQARTVTLFYGMLAFSHSVVSVCRGTGHPVFPMIIMLSIWCVLRISYILLAMRLLGDIVYVYWAYPITWSITSVIYAVYLSRLNWQSGFQDASAGS